MEFHQGPRYLYQIPGQLLKLCCEQFGLTQIKLVRQDHGAEWAVYGNTSITGKCILAFSHKQDESKLVLMPEHPTDNLGGDWQYIDCAGDNSLVIIRAKFYETGTSSGDDGHLFKEQLGVEFKSQSIEATHPVLFIMLYLLNQLEVLAPSASKLQGRVMFERELYPERFES